ncbi:MAG: Ribosomal protein [Candidatus Taylorbacteria bacterium]|nr:Ribosomal protein [Candidatus Taylorbacteria bacterium]
MQAIAKKAVVVKSDKEEIVKVYEIGYLLVSSIPKEKVADITVELRNIVTNKGANIIAEEAAEITQLAYTMIKKVGAANIRFNEGYFGWVKFELSGSEIEAVKKAFEENPNMLRSLIITTVRDTTYLGKKAPAIARSEDVVAPEAPAVEAAAAAPVEVPATVEDIDKSIDEMVK